MRNAVLILLISAFQVLATGSYSQTAQLNLKLKNATIKEVLTEIENQSEFYFLYNSELIDVTRKVDISVKNEKVNDILSRLFSDNEVNVSISDRHIVLTPATEMSVAQQQTVSGKVTDSSGQPLPGASVAIKGTSTGTVTDINGNYTILTDTKNVVLQFSFVGMKMMEVASGGLTELNVSMELSAVDVDEVVVIGYGTQRKSDLTGSLVQIKGEELSKLNVVNNVQTALQGQAAGVYVTQSTGAPGAGSDVIIRGQTSVTGLNNTLYVVDGIILSGPINSINPQDVESIEVLKDASAAAIYGSRASSGVVLITTKRGKTNEPVVNFNASYGWQSLSKELPLLNAQQWAEMQAEAIENNKIRFPSTVVPQNPLTWDAANNRVKTGITDSTDWQDTYYQVAPIKNFNLSFSGGSEKSKVFSSMGLQDQEGIQPNSYFKRYSFRINSDHKILNNRVKIGNNLALSYLSSKSIIGNYDYGSDGGPGAVMRMSPLIAAYKPVGSYIRDADRFGGSTDIMYYGELRNPLGAAMLNNSKGGNYNVTGNVFAEIEIIKDLFFHTSWGGEIQFSENKNFVNSWKEYINANGNTSLSLSSGKQYVLQGKNYFTYTKAIKDDHKFTIMAGTEFQDFYDHDFGAKRLNFIDEDNPDMWYLNLAPDSTATNWESASSWSILSYYSRFNYNFRDKYLVTATFRRDGSSRFDEQHRWGNFPSFSLGWKISNESFYPENDIVSDLKIRAGWGQLGNESSAGNYVTNETIGKGILNNRDNGYIFGTGQTYNTGARPLRIPAKDLSWETSEQLNFGIDLVLLKRRMTIIADYFIKDTKDMILSMQLPTPGRGVLAAPKVNIGTLQNKGFEFELNYSERNGDFNYNIGLNLTTTRGNKVTQLTPGVDYLDGGNFRNTQGGVLSRTLVGQSIGTFYLYEVVGIFKTQEDLDKYPKQGAAGIGDYIFRNADTTSVKGVQVIDEKDRVYYGNPWPLFIGGLNINLGYRNFDLNAFFQGSYGNDLLNTTRYDLAYIGTTENYNNSTAVLDRYHPEKNPNGNLPMLYSNDPANNRRLNSSMVEDGSYLRFQNLQIGYSLPKSLLRKAYIGDLRVYLGGSNLFTLTKYSGYTPDLGVRGILDKGIDRGVYPQAKTFTIGMNITL